jgi:hypothetical protein
VPKESFVSVTSSPSSTILEPRYGLPLAIVGLSGFLAFVFWGLGLAIALFGCFLMIQTATLRLHFTEAALDIYRGERLIRHFPYQDWQRWEIFWPGLPILFYFREVKSIHFLPILFDPETLTACLKRHVKTF